MWQPQLDDLAAEYDCVAVDLPGHGTRSDVHFTFDRAADMVAAAAGADGAIVVGLSLGGLVGIYTAAAHPELIRGLVVAGATANYRRLRMRFLAPVNWFLLAHVYPESWLRRTNEASFATAWPEFAQGNIEGGFWFKGASLAFREIGRHDFRRLASEYSGPVLWINGEKDAVNRRDEPTDTVVVEGAGHMVNLDQPKIFNASVRRFAETIVTS